MNSSEWRSLTVLVTGAGGFIGSHLAERLAREGANVRCLVRYASSGTLGWLDETPEELRSRMQLVRGDIRDPEQVAAASAGVDVIFHLAALISVPYSYEAPESFVETNVRGTLNVLQAARRHRVARVVHTSTSEVYGTPASVPIRETHPLRAQSPYAASKIAADKLAESFYCFDSLPVVILRPFNTFGPRQSSRAVIATVLAQLLAGKRKITVGALTPRRDFTYVDDTVEGFMKAAVSVAAVGQTVQLGTGRDVSIRELIEIAMKVTGLRASILQEEGRQRPAGSEVERLLSQPALAEELIGWKPAVPLEEGLSRTAEWMRRHIELMRPERNIR